MTTPASDEWLDGIRQGNPEILGEMLQKSRSDLKRRIKRQLDAASLGAHISASDIVQNACSNVIRHHDKFRGQTLSEWQMWVRKIASNFLLKEMNKHLKRKFNLLDILPNHPGPDRLLEQLLDSSRSPSSKIVRKETVESLRAAIQELGSRDQKLIQLRCELGQNWAMIGQTLGCSGDTAWRRFHHSVLPELKVRLEFLHDSA